MHLIITRFAHPIYVNGDYPSEMRLQINRKDKEMNATNSRLPEFTEAEKNMIKGEVFSFLILLLWERHVSIELYIYEHLINHQINRHKAEHRKYVYPVANQM